MPAVLVVDDNAPFAENLAEILGAEGYDVRVAHDGREALALLARAAFDLVLLDVRMPLMDGIAVHERASRDRGPRHFIFVTAATWDPRLDDMQARGMAVVPKPVDLDGLLALIARTLCES